MNTYTNERTVTLMQKLESNSFIEKNAKIFTVTDKSITANDYAQRKLLSNSDFLIDILPVIVGVDEKDTSWRKIVSKYLHEVNIIVPLIQGKVLNNSIEYDITSLSRKDKIKTLGTFKTSEALANYVEENIEEIDKHYYGTPVDYVDYFAYVFAYYHSHVANSIGLVKRSNKINFYMVTKEAIEQRKTKAYATSKSVRKYLNLIDEKPALFRNICIALKIKGDSDLDKYANLEVLSKSNPTAFLAAVQDKNLKDKAMIHSYITSGLIFKIPNSGVLVDATDRTVIIGGNMIEAISFFANPSNKDYIDTLASHLLVMNKSK